MKTNRSTGPRSAEGKAHSSMNALKSGIYSKSLLIPGEKQANLDTLNTEYHERFHPVHPEERDLVDILVRSTWSLRRFAEAESQIIVNQMGSFSSDAESPLGHAFCCIDRSLGRLQRMVNSTQRNYRDALHELERLRALPINPDPTPAPRIEIVPPPGPPGPAPQQPAETTPVNPSEEFVSSTSVEQPLVPATPALVPVLGGVPSPRAIVSKLPFHRPGSQCYFDPLQITPYERCPLCFPGQDRLR